MIEIDIVIEDTSFYGDTTIDFFNSTSALEYREFHDSVTNMARQVLGVKYALNHPICLSMLDDYKGMLIVMGVNFLEVKRYRPRISI